MTTAHLNGKATRLRDRFPEADAHIRWCPSGDAPGWVTHAEPLSEHHLKEHAAGRAVVGTYPAANGVARAGVIDIDLHLDRDPTRDEIAVVGAYALKKYQQVTDLGVDAVLLRHHLFGSFHIVFFVKPVAADRLGRWLKTIVADAGAIHVDTFPSVDGGGNAVRLPGRHHRRPDSWTEVLAGGTWEPWPACVGAMIGLRDNDARAFPDPGKPRSGSWEPPPPPPEPNPDARRRAVEAIAERWPNVGTRRDAALALAGGLLRAGYAVAWVEEFVGEAAGAAKDDEIGKRVNGVADTARSLEDGGHVTGWARLTEVLGDHGRSVASAVMGWLNVSRGSKVTFGGNSAYIADSAQRWADPMPLSSPPAVPSYPAEVLPTWLREGRRRWRPSYRFRWISPPGWDWGWLAGASGGKWWCALGRDLPNPQTST